MQNMLHRTQAGSTARAAKKAESLLSSFTTVDVSRKTTNTATPSSQPKKTCGLMLSAAFVLISPLPLLFPIHLWRDKVYKSTIVSLYFLLYCLFLLFITNIVCGYLLCPFVFFCNLPTQKSKFVAYLQYY
ncbi:hypothetical protein BX070DRAFT_37858 [Coemansia spiralis]|nr:hypothetical protein BX070DRAFT_37858 [Coemansia spiralis]